MLKVPSVKPVGVSKQATNSDHLQFPALKLDGGRDVNQDIVPLYRYSVLAALLPLRPVNTTQKTNYYPLSTTSPQPLYSYA